MEDNQEVTKTEELLQEIEDIAKRTADKLAKLDNNQQPEQ